MPHPIHIVDAFTDVAFAGNPAAVCLLSGAADPVWMQKVAAEMNLSETAFVAPRGEGAGEGFDLRWFTPRIEVDLCGHATLASAHVLWESGRLADAAPARFHSLSGWLTATRDGAWIELDFPAEPAKEGAGPDGLAQALGVSPVWVGRNRMDILVAVETEREVRELQPDLVRLAAIETRGVIVTAPAARTEADFVSRFFAPRAGVNEDPVTGSAHCALGPFWGERLGRTELTGVQLSPRGGVVRVKLAGARVRLAGQAVTIMRGALT